MEGGAAQPKEHLIRVYIRATRTRAARRGVDELQQPPSRITSCTRPCSVGNRAETQTKRERERGDSRRVGENEGEEEGTARRRKRKRERLGRVAFNQSPASKCTVHVYVYTAG